MKIVTLCGSLKFQKEMMKVAEKMALEGHYKNDDEYQRLTRVQKI